MKRNIYNGCSRSGYVDMAQIVHWDVLVEKNEFVTENWSKRFILCSISFYDNSFIMDLVIS